MRGISNKYPGRFIVVMLLVICLVLSAGAAVPAEVFADDGGDAASESADIHEIWVVPEVISGARQPASGGMFAWVTFDYNYAGTGLQKELDPADFMLQKKEQGGDWEDVPGNKTGSNITVLGGYEYYIASFEAIVAARVPDNTDPFIKKWRVVYKPGDDEQRIESEVIVQAAALDTVDDISVFDKSTCYDYSVEQVPWSYDDYLKDSIPPIYIAHVYPDAVAGLKDTTLTASDNHRIVLPWMDYSEPWTLGDNGVSFSGELLEMMDTDLRLGVDTYADPYATGIIGGIADLTGYWNALKEDGLWTGGDIPGAEELYRKLASTVCVPDEDADEYLSYVVEGSTVFWVSGAGTEERMSQGVSDYILVVVRDWEAGGAVAVKHQWSEPVWSWEGNDTAGYTSAVATFGCANNDGHTRTIRAIIRCTSDDDDNLTYTAIAALDGVNYRDTRLIKAPAEDADSEPETKPGAKTQPQTKLKSAPVSINTRTVTAASVKKAVAAAARKGKKPSEFVIGKNVSKISKKAFKGTNAKTLVIKSKKLTKKSVKGSLTGSKIKTVKVKIGSSKVNKKYIKKYKKFFTRKNAGRKAAVK